jgi:hypothetical protein
MRTPGRLTFLALLFALGALRATALELVQPAPGAVLRGGSFVTLEWSADDLPAGADEWEAFLSVDGGRYYAYRITPHLDLDLHRFVFIVPNVDAANATILIRAGDEERESGFEIPGSFSIVRDPNAARIAKRLSAMGRGEAAREGDPGVLQWTDGSRDGSGVTIESSVLPAGHELERSFRDESERVTLIAPGEIVVSGAEAVPFQPESARRARAPHQVAVALDLLLVCRRRNI